MKGKIRRLCHKGQILHQAGVFADKAQILFDFITFRSDYQIHTV